MEIDTPELAKVSYAQTELVGVVSRRRLVRHLTDVDRLLMAEVAALLSAVLDL